MKAIKSPPNSFRWLTGITGLIIISHVAMLILVKDERLRTVLYDIVSPVENILLAGMLFFTAHLTANNKQRQVMSWRLWAFAFACYALGDICWAVLEVILKQMPFPSIADLFYSLSYIFLWLGLIRYPVDEFSKRERKLVLLDNLIVMISAGLAYWVFLINPMLLASGEVDFFSLLLAMTYPILDMVLLWTLLIFFRNRLQQSTYTPLVLMGVCLLGQIMADSMFAYQSINNTVTSDALTKIGWTAGLLFLIAACITQVNSVFAKKDQPQVLRIVSKTRSVNSWPLYLPYIWLVISYGILMANTSMDGNSLPIYLVVGLIGGLVVFRQVLTLNDNEHLFIQAEAEITGRKLAQEALYQANVELDARVQERTKDLFVANALLGQTNVNLNESLHEKEVLLKEIHHRVKNNLQVIVSLLRMQARGVKDPETVNALQNSQTRVQSMSLIHEKLYQSKSLAKIDFGDYIKDLTTDLFRIYQRNLGEVRLSFQLDDVALGLDQAVPCGLILNELVTNALKYAFPDNRKGTIWVEMRAGPEQTLSLQVSDDGVGCPADFDIRKTKSLGLQLVNSLVSQLDGKLEVEHAEKTLFRISFAYC